jgi:hypothetical protein
MHLQLNMDNDRAGLKIITKLKDFKIVQSLIRVFKNKFSNRV